MATARVVAALVAVATAAAVLWWPGNADESSVEPPTGLPSAVQPVLSKPQPCRSRDLDLISTTQKAATGHVGRWAFVRNVGPKRCTLTGFPALAGVDARGNPIAFEPIHGTWFWARHPEPRALLNPGQRAMTVIETSMGCGDQTAVYDVRDVRVVLPDGAHLPLGVDLASSCPIRIDSWQTA